ncbi:MAG: hypothetical protein EHM79_02070 [Geobacter sp.]|nr:MAG: hypothetical protein EHM79_02070 [Geobacter sp.]
MIRIEVKGIKEVLKNLDPKKVDKAAKSALNRVKTQAKTESVRRMSKIWNIKQSDLLKKSSGKDRIETSGYIGSDLTAHIYFMSGGISLAYLGATEFRFKGNTLVKMNRKSSRITRRTAKDRTGVQVQTLRGGRVTRLRAFFSAVKFGKSGAAGYHLGVFSRHKGGGRLPVYERKMISVATMIRKREVLEPLQKFIREKFDERFNHELKRQGLIK